MVLSHLVAGCVLPLTSVLVGAAALPTSGFSVGIELPVQMPVTRPVRNFLRELGIDYVNFYVVTAAEQVDPTPLEATTQMVALCEELGLDFSLATHHLDVPLDCLRTAADSPHFQGVVIDEMAHLRVLHPDFMHLSPDLRMIPDPGGVTTLEQAYAAALAGHEQLRRRQSVAGSAVVGTNVWPILHHVSARAGLTVCPKICKELYSPVAAAIGLGAAHQYQRPFWLDCDLWFYAMVPGHEPEEFRSNLLLAYWLGADRVYVEGSGFNLARVGHQGVPFSHMNPITDQKFQFTPHGAVLRWFCRDYLPNHPRDWSFRDVRPDVAIVRFPDGCHGQRFLPGDLFPDRLYGCPALPSTRATEAWLGLWNALTFNATGANGLTVFKGFMTAGDFGLCPGFDLAAEPGNPFWPSYVNQPGLAARHRFFVPLRGAVVYDHTVGYDLLKDVPLLVLTGHAVTEETFAAIRRCVEEGATCVAWRDLAVAHGCAAPADGFAVHCWGGGRFALTDDFQRGEVFDLIAPFIGRPDEISYRFGDRRVILRRQDADRVTVETVPVS